MSKKSFVLELLDADCAQVLHFWTLQGDTAILGRSSDADVVFSSPFVSRTHASMRCVDGRWELTTISKSGVLVDGKPVTQLPLVDGVIFRLADRGPWLRFRARSTASLEPGRETIRGDSASTPQLVLDAGQLEREVNQVAQGDFFQELKRRTNQLRAGKSAAGEPPSAASTEI